MKFYMNKYHFKALETFKPEEKWYSIFFASKEACMDFHKIKQMPGYTLLEIGPRFTEDDIIEIQITTKES